MRSGVAQPQCHGRMATGSFLSQNSSRAIKFCCEFGGCHGRIAAGLVPVAELVTGNGVLLRVRWWPGRMVVERLNVTLSG